MAAKKNAHKCGVKKNIILDLMNDRSFLGVAKHQVCTNVNLLNFNCQLTYIQIIYVICVKSVYNIIK